MPAACLISSGPAERIQKEGIQQVIFEGDTRALNDIEVLASVKLWRRPNGQRDSASQKPSILEVRDWLPMGQAFGIIVAGGEGIRMDAGMRKQYLMLDGLSILRPNTSHHRRGPGNLPYLLGCSGSRLHLLRNRHYPPP